MTLVVPLAAYFGLAIVAALRFPVLRSREAQGIDIPCEFDDLDARAVNEAPRFPYFG